MRGTAELDGPTAALEPAEVTRYSRHLLLPQLGLDGQQKLRRAKVLIVGVGGLGSPVALYLAAAGVGTLGLVEFDDVDLTNLQRQILYGSKDVGRPKVESASARLADANPHVKLDIHHTRLSAANAMGIVDGYHMVVDGTDNFATRYLVNDACVISGIPNVYGSVFRFDGQASVFCTAAGPCYRCIYPTPPPPNLVPSCAEGGVLGVLPGLVGTIQATETLKLILGIGKPLIGRLLLVDALEAQFRTMKLRRDPQCPACGTREIKQLIDYEQFCGSHTPERDTSRIPEIEPCEVARRISEGERFLLLDVREPGEWQIARIPGATLIPLGELASQMQFLDRSRPIAVHCKSGARSSRAVAQLLRGGFELVWNVAGGIVRWRKDVDPTLPEY